MSGGEKKVLVFLSKGLESPMVARSALLHATASAAMGMDTTIYFAANATEIAHRDGWKKEKIQPGAPTLKQRLEEAASVNVKFKVCSQSMHVMGIAPSDLIQGAEVCGAATLVELALNYDTVISF